MKKTKPIMKLNDNQSVSDWVISEFPESYQSMIYVDVLCGDLNIFISKERSKLEILNDTHEGVIQIYRAIRDESSDFCKKVSGVRCTENNFQKYLENQTNKFDDYIDKAVNEFILRKMSKGENKKIFSNKKIEWKKVILEINELSKRLQESFIMNKDPLDLIQKFNHNDTLLFFTLPTNLKESYYTKLSNILKNFSGKTVIACNEQKIYKQLFQTWKLKRKIFNKLNNKKILYIWKNF